MVHRRTRWRSLLCALMIVLMTLFHGASALAVAKGEMLIVTADYTRMRARPQSGSKVIGRIGQGTKVKFIQEYQGWAKVQLGNGKTGFIYKTYLAMAATSKLGKLYASKLADGQLRVYNQPSRAAKVDGRLNRRTLMVLIERKGKWGMVRIVKNGKVGYVRLNQIQRVK